MKVRLRFFLAASALCAVVPPAFAGDVRVGEPPFVESARATIDSYRAGDSLTRVLAKYYVFGLVEGMNWTNTALQRNGRAPIFCTDEALTTDRDIEILEQFLAQNTDAQIDTLPTGLVLREAFQASFPCRQK